MTNTFLAIAKGLLEGIGSAAIELNKQEAERERERRNKAQQINITVDSYTPRERVYVETRRTETTYNRSEGVTYVYGFNELNEMTDDALRDEVYTISNEKFTDQSVRKEAKNLYYEHSYFGSQTRYRARMIKFLYENGQI